jgi:short-subunit dehydrogenase
MDKFDFTRGTAIVTGAASGIGEQLAHALARRGSALALVDRDGDRLNQVAEAVTRRGSGRPLTCYVTDLADDAATHVLGDKLAAAHPDAHLLVNNAGVALGGTFEQVSEEEFDWLLAINLRAVITLTRALLPVLRANPGSHLVNVSSLFGLIAPAGQVAYSTSKFAVRGFTEALRAELEGEVGVTVVHPGGIRTRIAETARVAAGATAAQEEAGKASFVRLLTYPPERAAEQIAAAVEGRRGRLLIATSARIPDVLARLAPERYPALLKMVQNVSGGSPSPRAR